MWNKLKNFIIDFYKFMEDVQIQRAKAIVARHQ